MNSLLTKRERYTFPLGALLLSSSFLAGCGSGNSPTGSAPPTVSGPVTPTVTIAASPSGSVSTAQALNVAVAVAANSGTPLGSVILSSGNYASFPVNVTAGQAAIDVPAGLLAVGTDTLTANFIPSDASSYSSASGKRM